uniref:YhcN/YlaJ family sporulation lipoprotein n=1 Tax=Cohnella candidum TaxID=2674991 RepID=A0A3G3K4N3_9BACL|nr:YhcN/YlaJ family sporulation lipoprotein [Cohnella candidum]
MLLAAAAAAALSGCAANKQGAPMPNGGVQVRTQNAASPAPINTANAKSAAAHLEALAKRIHGVKGANCVVFGKYAVVGIDVDPAMERSRVGTVKYAVAEAFRKDPIGINALVTADIDMAQRLREIRADVRRGRPVAGFAEELADIVGRIVPQIPRNIVPPASPENTGAPNAHAPGR